MLKLKYDVQLPETYKRTKWRNIVEQFSESRYSLAILEMSGEDKPKRNFYGTAQINNAAKAMHRDHIHARTIKGQVYIFNELAGGELK